MKLNVALIFGGCSSEHEVSVKSATTIITNMSQEKYNVLPIYITKKGEWLLYEGPRQCDLKNIQWDKLAVNCLINYDRKNKGILRIVGESISTIPIDVIFPVLHGLNGEDGSLQGIFELANIPYVGCNIISSAMSFDKAITKIVVDTLNIKQAKYLEFTAEVLSNLEDAYKEIKEKIGYPCFIKPCNEGSSVGISKCKNKKEVFDGLAEAFKYDFKIVVEKGIKGREVECAILGDGLENTQASCIGEILTSETFYDYDAKYNNPESETIVPADISEELSEEIRESALKIFKKLGCSGLSRVDFFIETKTDNIIFNEINTLPGFTSISMYPMLWAESGIKTDELIDELINLAVGEN